MIFYYLFLELVSRGCQTQPQFSKYAQTSRNASTQTAVPGVYLSTKNDYVMIGTGYRTSQEYRKLQIKAVIFHIILGILYDR